MVFIQQCDYVKILHQEHEIVTVDEWLDEFDEIIVEIPIELELQQSNAQIAVITGPDYKIANLSLLNEDKVLKIDATSSIYERKDQVLTIRLPIKKLEKITLNKPTILNNREVLNLDAFTMIINGPGTYSESNLNLNCNSVYLGAHGKNSGDHILKGAADELTLRLEGLAWTDASELVSSKVTVFQRSMKNSYVHATDQLIVKMYSQGNVYYTGLPELDIQIIQPDWSPTFGQVIHQEE